MSSQSDPYAHPGFLVGNPFYKDERGGFGELAKIEKTAVMALSIGGNLLSPMDKLQINYSFIRKGAIKAWHRHRYQDDIFIVLSGVGIVHTIDSDVTKAERFVLNGEGAPSPPLWIPRTYYHGISAIEDVRMIYFVNNFYNKDNPDEEKESLYFWDDAIEERFYDDPDEDGSGREYDQIIDDFQKDINWGIMNK